MFWLWNKGYTGSYVNWDFLGIILHRGYRSTRMIELRASVLFKSYCHCALALLELSLIKPRPFPELLACEEQSVLQFASIVSTLTES